MKNPGCANNRGSPLHASGNLSYQITLLSNPPAAMIFKPKPPPAMMMSRAPKPASVQISTFLGECLQVACQKDLTLALMNLMRRKVVELQLRNGKTLPICPVEMWIEMCQTIKPVPVEEED